MNCTSGSLVIHVSLIFSDNEDTRIEIFLGGLIGGVDDSHLPFISLFYMYVTPVSMWCRVKGGWGSD